MDDNTQTEKNAELHDSPPEYTEAAGATSLVTTGAQPQDALHANHSSVQQVAQPVFIPTFIAPNQAIAPANGLSTNRPQIPVCNIVGPSPMQYIHHQQLQPGLNNTVVLQQPATSPVLAHFSGTHPFRLGITQVVLAVLVIGVNAVGVPFDSAYWFVAHGFWGGITFVASGGLAIAASKKKTYKLVSTTVAMNIVATIFAVLGFAVSIVGAIEDASHRRCNQTCWYYTYLTGILINSAMVILFFAEMVCAFTTSVFGCCGGGCCPGIECCPCCDPPKPQVGINIPSQATSNTAFTIVTMPNGNTQLVPININNSNANCNNDNDTESDEDDGDMVEDVDDVEERF